MVAGHEFDSLTAKKARGTEATAAEKHREERA
jgi:hypothetical protein